MVGIHIVSNLNGRLVIHEILVGDNAAVFDNFAVLRQYRNIAEHGLAGHYFKSKFLDGRLPLIGNRRKQLDGYRACHGTVDVDGYIGRL